MASAQLAAQFGLQLVRRDGKWDKVNPTARPENGQRLAGYVGYTEMCIQESEVGGAGVDGFKSYAPFSLPRALYFQYLLAHRIEIFLHCSFHYMAIPSEPSL